jgi:hypothetical protein
MPSQGRAHLFRSQPTGKPFKNRRNWLRVAYCDRSLCVHDVFNSDDPREPRSERLTVRTLPSASAAERWFKSFLEHREKEGFKREDALWCRSIDASGRRVLLKNGVPGKPEKWPKGPCIERLEVDRHGQETTTSSVRPKAKPAAPTFDPKRLRALVRGFAAPGPTEPLSQIVERVNLWWKELIAAGLPQEQRDFERAIKPGKPYALAQIRAAEQSLGEPPARALRLETPTHKKKVEFPPSLVAQLREVGDLSVRGKGFRMTSTNPLRPSKGRASLKADSDLLDWEVEQHGEHGSFTETQIANRRWLRYAQQPGDSFWVMDLGNVDSRGECAIYLVSDTDLPTHIHKAGTVHGVREWLHFQVAELRKEAAKAIGARR